MASLSMKTYLEEKEQMLIKSNQELRERIAKMEKDLEELNKMTENLGFPKVNSPKLTLVN